MSRIEVPGGCHCGAVRWTAWLDSPLEVHRCNCSLCRRCGYLHVIVDAGDFRWLRGPERLSEYRFNTGTARHLFCPDCGVKSVYVPRSHPQGYSLNFHCLELPGTVEVRIVDFDGQNWERNISKIR